MKTNTQKAYMGDMPILLISEIDENGKEWDTKVVVDDSDYNDSPQLICWVSGEEKEAFLDEIGVVISKYRI